MKPRKFYKAKLPGVVWDLENDKVLARFERGQHTTEDERTAEILRDMGYPEVALDAETPPILPDPPLQPKESSDVRILGKQVTEETVLSKEKREAKLKAEKEPTTKKATTKKERKLKRRGKD